jgi:L-iditol 2-dehydrogenase
MLELLLRRPRELHLEKMQPPAPLNPDEVRIRTILGGICGGDLRGFEGKFAITYPHRMGHEMLGTVIECGEEVQLRPGQRIVVQPNTYCETCEFCKAGKRNLCVNKKTYGGTLPGGFAEEFVIPAKYVFPVPDEVPDERAVLVEPMSVVVHALKKVTIEPGKKVAVIGCGSEGTLASALAAFHGAEVAAIDINQSETKKQLISTIRGNVQFYHPEDEVLQRERFDVVIEAAGVPASAEQAFQIVKPGGDVVLIGIFEECTLPVRHIVRNEITIHGSIIYDLPDDYEDAFRYLKDESFVLPTVKLVPLEQFEQAFAAGLSGNYCKVLLDFRAEGR